MATTLSLSSASFTFALFIDSEFQD